MANDALNLLIALLPEALLLAGGAALVVLLPRERGGGGLGSRVAAWIAIGTVVAAVLALQLGPRLSGPETFRAAQLGGIVLDGTARAARWAALLLGILLIGANYSLPQTRPGRPRGDRATPEFFMLLLFSLAGLMLTGMANDLIVLFLALELTSVPTFMAVALSRPQHGATEAAGKYFFLGALSAALLVMGLAYLYGISGETGLDRLSAALLSVPRAPGYVLLIGMGLVLAGLAFKIAAFPFHVYIADVYEGSAAPVAGWLSFVPKAAGFLALGRILAALSGSAGMVALETHQVLLTGWIAHPIWSWMIWGLAVATMTAGNVLALWQRSVKRLLAYSSVAHSGYLLVALLVIPESANLTLANVLLFYLVVYGIANLGAFLVLAAVRVPDRFGGTREAESFAELHGLSRRRPALAIAMAIFVFTLMGLPPTAGFLAKVYVFSGALRSGFVWLVVIALVNAAVGAAYYLRVVAACWSGGEGGEGEPGGAGGEGDAGDANQRAGRSPGPEGADLERAGRSPGPDSTQAHSTRPGGQSPFPQTAAEMGTVPDDADHRPPSLVIAVLAGAALLFGFFPAGLYDRLTKDVVITSGGRQPQRPSDAEPPPADR